MTIPLYPQIVYDSSNLLALEHGGSDVDAACEEINTATKGWGANKQKVIDALATHDATTRTYIAVRYKELYSKDLLELMKKEFGSSDFGNAIQCLSLRPDQAEALMIKLATKGIGCQTNVIWSICCGRTNQEIDILKKTFFTMFNKDMGKLLGSELHGDMERLVFNCLQGAEEVYNPQYHTYEKATEDAETIYQKGQGKFWGTDERGIFKIIGTAPKEHLENIDKAYSTKYGYTLLKAMEKELGGMGEKSVRQATIYWIGMKLKPYEAMAQLIKDACAGFGTDEFLLTCCCIRYQSVMSHVMASHIELFGKSIHERVKSECGGKFKTLLLQVLNTAWPEQGN